MKEQPPKLPELVEKTESVSEVLKRVARECTKQSKEKEKEAVERERAELDRLEKLLAARIYSVLCLEIGKIVSRHVTLRGELLKLVEDIKELKQVLTYYDF